MNRERYLERARIAFGMNAQARGPALKAWNTKWHPTSGGSYYKAVGTTVQIGRATQAATTPAPLKAFHETATNYAAQNAVVDLSSTGRDLTAGGSPVVAIKSAGTDRYAGDLSELTTQDGRVYRVARSVLKRN
jgi:hypothetical protein